MKTFHKDYKLQYNHRDDSSLKISGITYIQTKAHPDWSFPLHSHEDELELSLVLEGMCNLYYGGNVYSAECGDLVVKNTSVLHSETANAEQPFEQICLSLSGVRVDGKPHDSLLPKDASPIIKTGTSFPFLRNLFLYMMELYEHRPNGFEAALHDTAKALLSSVTLLLPIENDISPGSTTFPVIRDVVDYINKNYTKNITLEDLSKRFFFSSYYLARKFKDETGYTVNQYIINCRMGEAERMLLFENYSIKDIALKTGYTNIQYFYATFKKYAGCTPAEFKNLYKRAD